MAKLQLNDTVALVSRLLFDDDVRREGQVVGVADDGMVTVEIPQPGLPGTPCTAMRVTSAADHFTIVRQAPVYERAADSGGWPLWMHPCGYVAEYAPDDDEPAGPCNGDPDCEAAVDDWRPLYLRIGG